MHPQEFSSERYVPRVSQANQEKLRPITQTHRILNATVLIISLFYSTLILRSANWNNIGAFLSLINILVVNSIFFWLTNLGKRKIAKEVRALFYAVSFISAIFLVYLSRVLPEGMIYFLAAWIIAVLLNVVVYNRCVR